METGKVIEETFVRIKSVEKSQKDDLRQDLRNDSNLEEIITMPLEIAETSSYMKNYLTDISDNLEYDNSDKRYIILELPFDTDLIKDFTDIMIIYFHNKEPIVNRVLRSKSKKIDILKIARYLDVRSTGQSNKELYDVLVKIFAEEVFNLFQYIIHKIKRDVSLGMISEWMKSENAFKMKYPNWLTQIIKKDGGHDKDIYMSLAKNISYQDKIDIDDEKVLDQIKQKEDVIDLFKQEEKDLYEEIENCFSEIVTYKGALVSVPIYEGDVRYIFRHNDKQISGHDTLSFTPNRVRSLSEMNRTQLTMSDNGLRYKGPNIFSTKSVKNINATLAIGRVEKISCGVHHIAVVSKGKLIIGGDLTNTFSIGINTSDEAIRSLLKIEDIEIKHTVYGSAKFSKINFFNKVEIVSSGMTHILVLADGDVYMLGGIVGYGDLNDNLNDNNIIIRDKFRKLDFFSGKKVTKIISGYMSFMVIADNELYVLGPNLYGCFGSKDIKLSYDRSIVTKNYNQISCIDFGEKKVTDVSTKFTHTAVVADGELYTLGKNKHSQLGFDRKIELGIQYTKRKLNMGTLRYEAEGKDRSVCRYLHTPTKVEFFTGKNITHISCGEKHTSVVADGRLYMFGKIDLKPEYLEQDEENMGIIMKVKTDPRKKIIDLCSGKGTTSIVIK